MNASVAALKASVSSFKEPESPAAALEEDATPGGRLVDEDTT